MSQEFIDPISKALRERRQELKQLQDVVRSNPSLSSSDKLANLRKQFSVVQTLITTGVATSQEVRLQTELEHQILDLMKMK